MQRGNLTDAWTLFQLAQRNDYSLDPLCFGALLMECEQRDLFHCAHVLLQGLEGAAGNRVATMSVKATTKHVAAMRLS